MATATAAAVAATTFRSLLHPTAGATNRLPLPPPRLRFLSLQHHRVGLHLFSSPRHSHILRVSSASSDAEAFSSDGEDYADEEEEEEKEEGEEYVDEEEEEEEVAAEVQAPRGYYPPRSRPAPGQEPGRLFVGNLPYTMTSAELSKAFSGAGRVDDVQIIYDKVTDRSRGFAFVTMATAEEATKAIQMFDGALLGGRTARVNFPEVPRGGERSVASAAIARGGRRDDDGTHKIYAGNLGWGVRADALRAPFEGQSGLLGARVIFERDSGRSRGFGFVSFTTAEDAQAALEAMDGVELEGRPLRLSLAEQNPPAGSPSTVQAQQEETASEPSEAEMEAASTSELSGADIDESNLQTTASY